MNNAVSAKADQSTTYTKTEVENAVGTKANKSAMAIAIGGNANAPDVYTKNSS